MRGVPGKLRGNTEKQQAFSEARMQTRSLLPVCGQNIREQQAGMPTVQEEDEPEKNGAD